MGFFRDVGRKVERAKRAATGGDEDGDERYRCQACDARFDTDHDFCPDCGAAAVTESGEES